MTNNSNFALRYSKQFARSCGDEDPFPNAAKVWFVTRFSKSGNSRKIKKKVNLSVHRLNAISITETFTDSEKKEPPKTDGATIKMETDTSIHVKSGSESLEINPVYTNRDVDQVDSRIEYIEDVMQNEEPEPSVYVETPHNSTVDREYENKQTSGTHDRTRGEKKKRQTAPKNHESDQYLFDIWKTMKQFGEPRVVVSVVGAYNERTPTYEMADNLMLKKASNHVARFAGRCGFIYKKDDTNFVQSVVYKCAPICDLPQLYGFSSVFISDNEKEQVTECVLENDEHHTGGTEQNLQLFDIERYINSKGQVSFEDGKKESRAIRVPVVLLVVNGDLDTLKHIKKAIYNNMSVVVVKGTGGAADLIASCLESFSMNKLKRELPIMFNRRFTNKYFTKIKKRVKRITEKDWMITIFAVREDAHYKLWERMTDGIMRAWSLEEKFEDESINNGEYISKYVANIDGLTREELFAGYRINTADKLKGKGDEDENKTDQNTRLQNVYMIAFLGEHTETIRDVLTNNTNFYLSENNFKEIWKQKTSSISNTSICRFLESVYPDEITDHKAVEGISEKLLKGLCFSKIGMITCCGDEFENDQNMPKSKVSDTLRVEVFFNRKDTAAAIWCTCPNPMMTALISSMYLTALANIAEEQFEENMQEEYESHAELFLSRAVKLFEKMHDDDERMAIAALEYVSEVWNNIESPLHFAQQFNIEEFISHSKIQRDASRRLFPVNKHANEQNNKHFKSDTESMKTSNNKSLMNDSASQSTPVTTNSRNTETKNMSNTITEHPQSNDASKNASVSKSLMGDSASQITPDTTAAKNTEPQSMSDKTTEKAAASQNLSKNYTESNTLLKTQEPIFTSQTYSLTVSGCFSYGKENWRTNPLEMLTAPVARIAVHTVIFITALTMFSYFLIGNLDNGSISLLEGLVFIYMSGDFLEEIWSMFRTEKHCIWSHQRIILHLFNIWNVLDVLCSILYIVGFSIHSFVSISIVHTRRIYSISLFIMFLRLLNLLLLFKTFGIMIIMVKEMLVDLLKYLVILTILIFAAGVAYHANVYPNHQVEFWQIFKIIKIPYWQVYGELYLDTLEASDSFSCSDNATLWQNDPSVERCPTGDWITPVIAAVYMMLTHWLLLNIVIAMFGARFNAIQQKSEQKWRYNRHSVIIDYEDKIPSPLNFPWRIITLIKYSTQLSCRCCRCSKESKNGDDANMLAKQLEFAKIIIAEENHRTSP